MLTTAESRGNQSSAEKKSLNTTTSSPWGFAYTSDFGGTRPKPGEITPRFSMSSSMAGDIFVGPKKVEGGALAFFRAMVESVEVAIALMKETEWGLR